MSHLSPNHNEAKERGAISSSFHPFYTQVKNLEAKINFR